MPSPDPELPVLGFIGGTGPEGRGLALRFAVLGYGIVIGSRSLDRAEEAARQVRELVPSGQIRGLPNDEAAEASDIVILTIPYSAVADTLPALVSATRSKIVVCAIAPVEFEEGRPVAVRVPAGSAAQEVQQRLPDARVVSAFQNVDSHQLQNLEELLDCDVLVCSDDREARHEIIALAGRILGVRALSAGRLAASRYVEECTALLIILNRIYKAHSGLRITGVRP